MKSKAWTEKFMQGVFFVAACASVLAVALPAGNSIHLQFKHLFSLLVCKWSPCNQRNRVRKIYYRRTVETEQ